MTADQIRKFSARVRRRRIFRRTAMIALMGAVLFLLAERNFKPLVFSLAEARSAAMASQVLQGALAEALEDVIENGLAGQGLLDGMDDYKVDGAAAKIRISYDVYLGEENDD